MAQTTISPTNKSVKFGLKPLREKVKKLTRPKRKAVRALQARGMISETVRKTRMADGDSDA